MSVTETTHRGRAAWLIENGQIGLLVTRTGAHLGSLFSLSDPSRLSPLWDPQWPSGDPSTAAASGTWGTGEHAVEAPLLASICGSNLCADRFGAPHPGEERPLHGEAGVVTWARVAEEAAPPAGGDAFTVAFTAHLPLAQLQVTRAFTLRGSSVAIASTLEDRRGVARDVEVCEHTTLGGAFLDSVSEGGALDASVDEVGAEMAGGDAAPPAVGKGEALRVPRPSEPPTGSVRTLRVASEEAWWAASGGGWQLRASWKRADFPFLCVWTEHQSRHHAPWAGRERTRGMEASTKAFPEGRPPPSRADSFLGSPTRVTLPAGGRTTRTIQLAWRPLR